MESTENARHDGGDRLAGPLWVVFGVAVVVGALQTDRMAAQGVKWFGAPGLVPGLLGIAVTLAGMMLTWRAWRAPRPQSAPQQPWAAFTSTLLLCLAFAGVAIGHGVPFGVAAAVYLFVHIAFLQWRERRAAGQILRGLAVAAAVGVGGGILVPLVFEQIFLVRLP